MADTSDHEGHGHGEGHGAAPRQDPAMTPEQILRRTAAAFSIPLPPEDESAKAKDAHAGHDHAAHEPGAGAHGAEHGAAHHDAEGHGAEGHGGGHGAGGSSNLGRNIGMTMAVLGVLLAFSSAMVGGQRTEFVGTMIEQTSATGQFQAVATKHRVLQAQLQQLHSALPRQPEFDRNEAELAKLEAELEKLEKEQNLGTSLGETVRAMRLETKKILSAVVPTKEDLLRFAKLVKKYAHERETCEKWTESYEPCVKLHEEAAEHYELATLAAEIGIVMASIALLLQNRKTWILSMVFGAASVTILSITGVTTSLHLHATEHKIHEAKKEFLAAGAGGDEELEDERLLKDVTGEPFDPSKYEAAKHDGAKHEEPKHEAPKHGENH